MKRRREKKPDRVELEGEWWLSKKGATEFTGKAEGTINAWRKKGWIRRLMEGGRAVYSERDIIRTLGQKKPRDWGHNLVYIRVEGDGRWDRIKLKEQKDRVLGWMRREGLEPHLVEEDRCPSYQWDPRERPGMHRLAEWLFKRQVDRLVVEDRSRIGRLGWRVLGWLLQYRGVELVETGTWDYEGDPYYRKEGVHELHGLLKLHQLDREGVEESMLARERWSRIEREADKERERRRIKDLPDRDLPV
jgi:predicted site-specific integrase-resolvase